MLYILCGFCYPISYCNHHLIVPVKIKAIEVCFLHLTPYLRGGNLTDWKNTALKICSSVAFTLFPKAMTL